MLKTLCDMTQLFVASTWSNLSSLTESAHQRPPSLPLILVSAASPMLERHTSACYSLARWKKNSPTFSLSGAWPRGQS